MTEKEKNWKIVKDIVEVDLKNFKFDGQRVREIYIPLDECRPLTSYEIEQWIIMNYSNEWIINPVHGQAGRYTFERRLNA